MKTSFKNFMGKQDRSVEHTIELIHHIAEEELIACKILNIIEMSKDKFRIHAHCHDKPRQKGMQLDLTEKLNKRLSKQKFAGTHQVSIEVFHR